MSGATDRCDCCGKTEFVNFLEVSPRYWCRKCEVEFEMIYTQRKARNQLNLPLEILPGRRP